MTVEGGRAQDQGRTHRRKGAPSAETSSLLVTYQAAMRDELRAVLAEIAGTVVDGLLGSDVKRPSLEVRAKLWDLAIKLGRELGTEVDPSPLPGTTPAETHSQKPRSRGRVAFGPD